MFLAKLADFFLLLLFLIFNKLDGKAKMVRKCSSQTKWLRLEHT